MATDEGNRVSYGSGQYYAAQIVWSTSSTSTHTTITYTLRVYHSGSLYDTTNNARASGDWHTETYGSKDYGSSSGGYKSYKSSSKTFTRWYSAAQTASETFYVEDLADSAGGGARSTVTVDVTIPRRSYSSPGTPSRPTVDLSDWLTDSGYTVINWSDPSSWGGVSDGGDQRFDVEVATDSSFSNVIKTFSNTTSTSGWTRTTDAPNTTYYVRVRADTSTAGNGGGHGSWSSTLSFTTPVRPPSGGPTPIASDITANSARFTWGNTANWGGENNGLYRLQIATDAGFSTLVYDEMSTSKDRTVTLSPSVTYYFRLRPENSGGPGAWVEGTPFTTPGEPTVVQNLTVTDPGPIGAALDWDAPADWGGDTGTYDVQVALDDVYLPTVASATGLTDTQYVIPQNLQPNQTYFARVRAVNTFGPGPWVEVTFNTSAPPFFVKVAGTWRPTVANYVKVAGVWRQVVRIWVKNSGVWR